MHVLTEKIKKNWVNEHKAMTKRGVLLSFYLNREYSLAKDQYASTEHDNYLALAYALRDRVVERWIGTQQRYHKTNARRVYYLSMEFLIGQLLSSYMHNLGLEVPTRAAMAEIGLDLDRLMEQEVDAGLGNGGLGRLAACFLESMATLAIPAHGYGIRYDYGIFHQRIENGFQVEYPDEWLRLGCPWEFARPEYTVKVRFYGNVRMRQNNGHGLQVDWIDTEEVLAVPYDMPIAGYKNNVVNTLRLWSARSSEEFDFEYFNSGDYEQAVYKKIFSENISKVLYPNDAQSCGRELRLKQEYFFTAASIADIIRRFKVDNTDLRGLPDKVCMQLNDTHPALAIVELMRVLVDDHQMPWEEAWDITRRCFAYTNHTLMPEALECWSVALLEKVLPRHLQIIYEINDRFLKHVLSVFPRDTDRLRRMSLVDETDGKRIRMAYLSILGSHSVNGVSGLHSELLKKHLFKDFYEWEPEKFNNKTNGITQRRWLLKANPRLSGLITKTIGPGWVTRLEELKKLELFAKKASFRQKWRSIKQANKNDLAEYIRHSTGLVVDPASLFDVQVKRIHEYKRQLLFAFYTVAQYLRLKNDPKAFTQPRTCVFAGKAAPGYAMAKLIIKFINSVAEVVNQDKDLEGKFRVVFLENYRVSLAERIFPASELSEQISTAGTEASGTGNMKFMLNGALTIGTLDGANVEISERLGAEDIFIFGLKDHEVEQLKASGYHPMTYVRQSPMLTEIHHLLTSHFFSPSQPGLFDPITRSVFDVDPFLVCADFDAYLHMQDFVAERYQDSDWWAKTSIINTANAGHFSSDRTIKEYADEIWRVPYAER